MPRCSWRRSARLLSRCCLNLPPRMRFSHPIRLSYITILTCLPSAFFLCRVIGRPRSPIRQYLCIGQQARVQHRPELGFAQLHADEDQFLLPVTIFAQYHRGSLRWHLVGDFSVIRIRPPHLRRLNADDLPRLRPHPGHIVTCRQPADILQAHQIIQEIRCPNRVKQPRCLSKCTPQNGSRLTRCSYSK